MSQQQTPHVALFDVGGVLVESHHEPQRVAEILGQTDDAFVSLVDQAMWAHRASYDEGCSDREFWDRVAGDCGAPRITDDQIAQLVAYDSIRMHDAVEPAVQIIRELEENGIVLGILSNAPFAIAEEIRVTAWAQHFDDFVFSCEVGSAKPHRSIYREAIERFDVDAEDAVFIDDRKKNVRAAELLGMKGLLWENASQARADLHALGMLK